MNSTMRKYCWNGDGHTTAICPQTEKLELSSKTSCSEKVLMYISDGYKIKKSRKEERSRDAVV